MSLVKRFKNFFGQTSKLSPVLSPKDKLREATNVMPISGGGVIKRRGTAANGSDAGLGDGAVYYDEKSEALFIGDELVKRDGSSVTVIDNGKTGATEVSTTQAWGVGTLDQPSDTTELNGNIYIAKEGDTLKRYDGVTCSNAGMHPWIVNSVSFITVGGGGAGIAYVPNFTVRTSFVDANGNIIVSPDWSDLPFSVGNSPVATDDLRVDMYPDYFFHGSASWVSKYAEKTSFFSVTGNFSLSTDSGYADLALTVDSHNFVVGDWCFAKTTYTTDITGSTSVSPILAHEVVAQTATTLTLRVYRPNPYAATVTIASTAVNDSSGTDNIVSNMFAETFATNSAGVYGELDTRMVFIDTSATLNTDKSLKTLTAPIVLYYDNATPFTLGDTLIAQDTGISLPPICKLVEAHQNLLVLGNGSPYFAQRSDQLDTPVVNSTTDDSHTLYFSESSGLSSIREMFRGQLNSLYIGVPEDGTLEALVSHNGVLLAFKEKAIYQLTGTLDIATVRVDKVYGSGVGCVSRASVQEIGTKIFFLSNKGVYSIRGGQLPVEESTGIDDVFDDAGLQLTLAHSTHDILRNQYILHIPHTTPADAVTLVYDYEFQGWFVWKEMDASGGITIDATNDEVYFVNASGGVKVMKDARNDESSAITARIKTQHEDLGEPSLFKKFLNLKLFNLGGGGHVSTVKTYGDFSSAADSTTSLTTSSTIPFEKTKFDAGANKAHTMQIEIENAVVDEDMRIDALEIEYEASGRKMKQ